MQFVIEDDDGCKRVVYCITDRERFDTFSYEMLRECELYGLVVPQCTERNGLDAIQYNVSELDTIRNYLSFSLSINQLISVFSQIIEIVQNLDEYLLDNSMLITDIGQLYFDRSSNRVKMIYYPVSWENHSWRCEERIFNLFKEMIFSAKFVVGDDDRYIAELLNGINDVNDYSLNELKDTVDRIKSCIENNNKPVNINRYHSKEYQVEEAEPVRMVQEDIGEYGNEAPLLFEENDDSGSEKKGIRSVVKRLFGKKEKELSVSLPEEDIEFTEFTEENEQEQKKEELYDNETIVLMCGELGKHTPYMIRKSDGSRIDIGKRVFKVGKDKRYADYVISNNAAVSRAHAQFMIKDGKVFLTDEDSLNSTYVNSSRLEAGKETEINSGDVIMFADEEYVFYC